MIVARLEVEDDGKGGRVMVGRVLMNWPLKQGTQLVLRRVGTCYELSEIGERECRFSPDAVAAFVDTHDQPDWIPPTPTPKKRKRTKSRKA